MSDTTQQVEQSMHMDKGTHACQMSPVGASIEFAVNVGWAEAHATRSRYCGVLLVRSDSEAITYAGDDLDTVRAEVKRNGDRRTGCWWLILDTQWNDMPNNGAIIELDTIQVWRE